MTTAEQGDRSGKDLGHNARQTARRLGIEVEFGGLSARQAADLVQKKIGGHIREEDAHRFIVEDTRLGALRLELDSKYVHSTDDASSLERRLRRFAGEVGGIVVPTELITEPLPIDDLPHVDALIDDLAANGALGTQQPHLACGLHLNVSWPDPDIASILRIFQAYLLQAPTLREEIAPDTTRTLLPFIGRFSRQFEDKVLDPAYQPDLAGFIADYCKANPTKNRELDLLPILASMNRTAVADALGQEPQAVRPAFHYRLPNARLGDPDWSVEREWRRWQKIEALAADEDQLSAQLVVRKSRNNRREPVRAIENVFKRVLSK